MRIRLFAFCLLLGGCQSQLPPLPDWQSAEGRDDPQTGRIVELRSGVTLSPQQLVARLAAAPRVIVGEKHDNPDHHAVEPGWRRPWANIGRRAACCWKCSIPASNHGWMRSAHNSGPASRWRTWSRPWTGRKVGTGRSTDPWCPGRLRNPRRCWRRTSSGARSCASTGASAASRNGLQA